MSSNLRWRINRLKRRLQRSRLPPEVQGRLRELLAMSDEELAALGLEAELSTLFFESTPPAELERLLDEILVEEGLI